MKKYFMCYGNEKFRNAVEVCCKKASKTGFFDVVRGYSPKDLDPIWMQENENSKILAVKRGGGLWLWKPYLMLKTLQEMDDGDFLFYADSGTFFIRSPKYILQSMGEDDVWVTEVPLLEKQFTKPSLFKFMNCETPEFMDTRQIQPTFVGVRKNPKSMELIREWLRICSIYNCVAPEKKTSEHPDYYVAHREDQSILSLLCKQRGIVPHQDPTQFSKYGFIYCTIYDNVFYCPSKVKEYPIFVLSHRLGRVSWVKILKTYFRILLPTWLGRLTYSCYFQFLKNKKVVKPFTKI